MIKIFAVLMSLQLMMAPVAMAQNAGDQFRSNPEGKKSASYLNQIGSMAIAGVGTTVMMSCLSSSLLPSMYIFNAGSILYIAKEIMGGKAQNAFQNRKMSDMRMVEEKMKGKAGGEVQKEALEAALKDEKETLKIINDRIKWLTAISVVYGLATIAAIIEVIKAMNPVIPPTGQIAGCNVAGMLVQTTIVKVAVVGAWTFASMKSGEGTIGKYGSMAMALGLAFKGVGAAAAGMLQSPVGRIAAFALATGFIFKNKTDLDTQANTVKKNIADLEKVLAQFNSDTKTTNTTVATDTSGNTGGVNGGGGGTAGANAGGSLGRLENSGSNGNFALNGLPDGQGSQPTSCISQESTGVNFNGNCSNPLKLANPNFDAQINVPTLRSGANTTTDFANAVARGDLAGADAAAGKLEAMSGKIKEIRDGLLKQANQELAANGKSPIDLDAEVGKAQSALESSILGEATSQGMNLASLSPVNLDADAEKADEKKDSEITTASSNKIIADPNATNGMGMINEGALTNDSALSEGDVSQAPSLEDSLGAYEASESDISNRSEDDLFKQVSMRYQANYGRFFEKKKIDIATDPPK